MIVVYLSIGIIAFWPVYPGISRNLFGVDWDFEQSVWFLDWVPHALAHGLNPFFSNAMLVPAGVNLAQNTASPLLGLITAPLDLVFSPVVSANLLMLLAMPVSATAAFVVLRKWHVWGPAAAIGGLIYGFSPYMVGQSLDHVELIFVPLPPFIALTVASILQRRSSPRRLGIRLGLLVAAQYLISPEVLAVVSIFTILAVACVALRRRANLPEVVRKVWKPAGIAVAVSALLVAYPVWMMIAGPQHFTGSTWPAMNPYHNDLLSFVVPGPLQRVSLGMRGLGTLLAFGSGVPEAGGYIGVPLLILGGIFAWRSRRSARMQLAVFLLLCAMVLTLGPYLVVDGRLTHVPLPFLLLNHIPLLNDIVPSRICFEVGACLAALIAFGLDDMHRAPTRSKKNSSVRRQWARGRGSVIFAGMTLVILVATQLPQWPRQSQYVARPPAVLPTSIKRAVPVGDPVAITYPYATTYTMQPMLWQVEDGFKFRLLGGYAYHPNSSGRPSLAPSVMSPSGLQQFLAGQDPLTVFAYFKTYGRPLPVTPELVATTRATLSKYDVGLVIVDRSVPGSGPVMRLFNDALGPPKLSTGHFSLWANRHS